MASNAITAVGAVFEASRNGTVWTAIPEAKGAPVPGTEKDWQEVTHLGSGGYKEWVPGLKDSPTISCPMNYTADGYEDMLADEVWSETNGPLYYRVTMKPQPGQTTGDVHQYRAYPTISIDPNTDPGSVIMMTLTLRTSGTRSYTRGA